MDPQTYVFTVAVTGQDVQAAAELLREIVIDAVAVPRVDVHVTPSVRVTP